MLLIFKSLRLFQRQLANHFKRPLQPTLTAHKSITPTLLIPARHSVLQPILSRSNPWVLLPKPSSRPSALYGLRFGRPYATLSGFQSSSPFHTPRADMAEVDPISLWSADVAAATAHTACSLDASALPLTDAVIHDLVTSRFILPVLTPDDH